MGVVSPMNYRATGLSHGGVRANPRQPGIPTDVWPKSALSKQTARLRLATWSAR
jgi:hypothetical protein